MSIVSAFVLSLLSAGTLQDSKQESGIYLDKAKEAAFENVEKLIAEKDWKAVFTSYAEARKRSRGKLAPVEGAPGNRRWVTVQDHFVHRLSRLPKEAVDAYRAEADPPAKAAFEKARDAGDEAALRRAVEEYFFATGADRVLEDLGIQAFKTGRVREALRYWNRLLRYCPPGEVSRVDVAMRIATAAVNLNDEAAYKALREDVVRLNITGQVSVGDVKFKLRDYLAGIRIIRPTPKFRVIKLPLIRDPGDRFRVRRGTRNDILRWTYDFAEGKPPLPRNPVGKRIPPVEEYPLFTSAARVEGKDVVVLSDGTRVLAVDPSRVEASSTTKGIYWKHPPDARIEPSRPLSALSRPTVGTAIAGRRAYATMYSSNRPAPPARNVDPFVGVTSVACFDLFTGKVLWDTDKGELKNEVAKAFKAFHDRNFSFSGRPVVRNGIVALGVCTSPAGEQESWVVGLDAESGRPAWATFLCSNPTVRNRWGWNSLSWVVHEPFLVEEGGVVYAQTNQGVVAALDGSTGDLLWLTTYPRAVEERRFGRRGTTSVRPAGWPIAWKGTLYVLAQDHEALMGFDQSSGRPIDLPEVKKRFGEFSWRAMTHLVGIINDWMVLGGNQSHVLRLKDFQVYNLAASVTSRSGLGTIHDGLVYLSQAYPDRSKHPHGVLGVYDATPSPGSRGQPTWKNLAQGGWKEEGMSGNLLVAGDSLVVSTDKIRIYTDVETIINRYRFRLLQSPPNPDAFVEFAGIMEKNGRAKEAIVLLKEYLDGADGDRSLAGATARVRVILHELHLGRGRTLAGAQRLEAAAKEFRLSAKYAPDPEAAAEASRLLAEIEEKLKRER